MYQHPVAATLSRAFYAEDAVAVARALLGQRLVRIVEGVRLSGRICETEAYRGPDDPASHGRRRTPRSSIMYGPPGTAYIYFIYGNHHCLNAVTNAEGVSGAVLLRGIIPDDGVAVMQARRGRHMVRGRSPLAGLADGPGKLAQALGITLAENGLDLTAGAALFIESDAPAPGAEIVTTPRIGVRGDEETRLRPWRFVWQPAGPGAAGAYEEDRDGTR